MKDLADLWHDIGNEIGDKEMRPTTMAQILEHQILLQRTEGRNVAGVFEPRFPSPNIAIPIVYAQKIVEALYLGKKTKGGQPKTWRERNIYAVLLEKALIRKAELKEQAGALNAELEAAESLAKARPDLKLEAETIRRDMQRISKKRRK